MMTSSVRDPRGLRLFAATLLLWVVLYPAQREDIWRGRVVSGVDGQPMGGVRLSLDERTLAISDSDGAFELGAPVGSRLTLGAASHVDGFVILADRADPTATGVHDLGTLVLEPATVLLGRLIDDDGPVARAELTLYSYDLDHPGTERPEVTTAADGTFRFDRFAAPWGPLQLHAKGYGLVARIATPGLRALDVGDVRLPTLHSTIVRVTDRNGLSVADAYVEAREQGLDDGLADAGFAFTGSTGPDGSVAVRMPTGPIEISALSLTAGHAVTRLHTPSTDPVALTLGGTKRVAGRIVRGDRPVVRLPVTTSRIFVQGFGSITTGNALLPERAWTATTDADGCYELDGVPVTATLTLRFLAAGHSRHRAIQRDEPDSTTCETGPVFDLEELAWLDLAIRDPDGRPIPLARTELSQDRARPEDGIGYWESIGAEHLVTGRPGSWAIALTAPGYAPRTLDLDMDPGEYRAAVATLDPSAALGALDVRIARSDGLPVSGAEVSLSFHGNTEPGFHHRTLTGANGWTRVESVPSGPYGLNVRHHDQHASRRIDVLALSGERFAVALPEHGFVPVQGILLNAAGVPVPQGIVSFHSLTERVRPPRDAPTDRNGRFLTHAAPSEYRVRASAPGRGSHLHESTVAVTAEGMDGLEIRLGQPVRLYGRIAGLGPEALASTRIGVRPLDFPDSTHEPVARIYPDGRYEIRPVAPGRWRLHAGTGDGRRVDTEIEIPPGRGDVRHDVPFAAGFRVEGTATLNGVPIADEDIGMAGRGTRTDAEGRFVLDHVTPGTHPIYLRASGMDSPWAAAVDIRDDSVVDIPVEVARLTGRVLDARSGLPIRSAEIRVGHTHSFGSHCCTEKLVTDSEGRFDLGHVAHGVWTLDVAAEGYTGWQGAPEVPAVESVEIALVPTRGLDLAIRDEARRVPVDIVWQQADGTGVLRYGTHGGPGELHFPHVPEGPGILAVESYGGTAVVEIDNTGAPIEVTLGRSGRIEIEVGPNDELPVLAPAGAHRRDRWLSPAVIRTDGRAPVLEITDADGLSFPSHHEGAGRQLRARRFQNRGPWRFQLTLPPGTYSAVVRLPTGRVVERTIVLEAGQRTEIRLE